MSTWTHLERFSHVMQIHLHIAANIQRLQIAQTTHWLRLQSHQLVVWQIQERQITQMFKRVIGHFRQSIVGQVCK